MLLPRYSGTGIILAFTSRNIVPSSKAGLAKSDRHQVPTSDTVIVLAMDVCSYGSNGSTTCDTVLLEELLHTLQVQFKFPVTRCTTYRKHTTLHSTSTRDVLICSKVLCVCVPSKTLFHQLCSKLSYSLTNLRIDDCCTS